MATGRKAYRTDLSDAHGAILEPLIPQTKPGGRPRQVDMREVINTMLYLERTGCQWGLLPHDLLPKNTVYDYFAQWRDDGSWQRMMEALREHVRRPQAPSGQPSPRAASIDSPNRSRPPSKAVNAVTMAARKSAGTSATSSSMPWGSGWP